MLVWYPLFSAGTINPPLCTREPQCLCGRKKSEHKKNVIFGAAGEEWTPERCTAEEPTDAYGEIDFQGLGSRRVPVSPVIHVTLISVCV